MRCRVEGVKVYGLVLRVWGGDSVRCTQGLLCSSFLGLLWFLGKGS